MQSASPTHYQNYRCYLRDELAARSRKNSRYSLRAFARDIGLTSSRLSEILGGRYGLSKSAAEKISARLGLNQRETDYFCDLVDSFHSRSQVGRENAKVRLEARRKSFRFQSIDMDHFRIIADWHYFAILELALTKDFQDRPDWISHRLGINRAVAKASLGRLKKLGLLVEKDGKLAPAQNFATPSDIPSIALKNHHTELLKKAIDALQTQPVEEREFSTMTMAISRSKLKRAKEAIRKFQQDLCNELQAIDTGQELDDVFVLSTQLFNLSEGESE